MSGTTSSPTDDRSKLIQDAILFLKDPKVISSPLTQKIQFLESKGLSSTEIEQALGRVSAPLNLDHDILEKDFTQDQPGPSDWQKRENGYNGSKQRYGMQPGYGGQQQMMVPPPLPKRDWRDFFIMAVVSGGVMYGVVSLARKYLLPHLQPPSSTSFQTTSASLTAQFDEASTLLTQLQESTTRLESSVESEREKIDSVVEDVEEALKGVKDGEERWREELRELREEVTEVRDLVPKIIEKHAQAQQASLQSLQSELRSLKTLLLARRPTAYGDSSSPSSSSTGQTRQTGQTEISNAANALLQPRNGSSMGGGLVNGKPTLPSWQLESPKVEDKVSEDGEIGTDAT